MPDWNVSINYGETHTETRITAVDLVAAVAAAQELVLATTSESSPEELTVALEPIPDPDPLLEQALDALVVKAGLSPEEALAIAGRTPEGEAWLTSAARDLPLAKP